MAKYYPTILRIGHVTNLQLGLVLVLDDIVNKFHLLHKISNGQNQFSWILIKFKQSYFKFVKHQNRPKCAFKLVWLKVLVFSANSTRVWSTSSIWKFISKLVNHPMYFNPNKPHIKLLHSLLWNVWTYTHQYIQNTSDYTRIGYM